MRYDTLRRVSWFTINVIQRDVIFYICHNTTIYVHCEPAYTLMVAGILPKLTRLGIKSS